MARLNPLQFFQEVRQEVSKVVWPTRKEVWITTIAVVVMVAVASMFFLLVDQFWGYVTSHLFGFTRGRGG
jgi:preprotein translocase subunit SecE